MRKKYEAKLRAYRRKLTKLTKEISRLKHTPVRWRKLSAKEIQRVNKAATPVRYRPAGLESR